MFKKQNRLSSREFEYFFKHGKRHYSPSLQIIIASTEDLKVAVVVPKKILKSAVSRNRVRRRLYHILRPMLENYRGVFIFIIKKGILEKTNDEIKTELNLIVGGISKS